jgi:multiple sugar transport system substrate-binding protein
MHSTRRRTVLIAGATSALLLATAGCSSGGKKSADPSASGPAKGTITWYASTFGGGSSDIRKTLVKAFEQDNPGIKVKIQTAQSDTDANRATLTTQIAGGSSDFDVYMGDVVWPAQFGKAQLALPLSGHFPASYWKTFSPGLVDGLKYQGKVMAAPLFTDNAFLFYRKDLLAKAHLPVPTTWEQVESEAKTLQKKKLVRYGYAGQWASYEGLTCDWTEMAADAGAGTVNSAGTKSTIDSAASKKALTYMKGLVDSGVAPKSVTTFQEQQSQTLFTSGQDAFLRNWTYSYADANNPKTSKIVGKVGVTNLPTFQGQSGPGYTTTGGWNLYVNPHTKHLAADLAFIKWMTGEKAQKMLAVDAGVLPTRAGILDDPQVQKTNPVFAVAAKNKLVSRPSNAAEYAKVSQAIYTNLNAVLSGSGSPSSALSKANSQINQALGGGGL